MAVLMEGQVFVGHMQGAGLSGSHGAMDECGMATLTMVWGLLMVHPGAWIQTLNLRRDPNMEAAIDEEL